MVENRGFQNFKEFLGTFLSHPRAAITAFLIADMTILREFFALFDIVITSYIEQRTGFGIQNFTPSLVVAAIIFIAFYAYVTRGQDRVRLELSDGESLLRMKFVGFDDRQIQACTASAFICYRHRTRNNSGVISSPFHKFPLPEEFVFSKSIPFVMEFPILQDFFQYSPQIDPDIDPEYSVVVTLRIKGEFFLLEKRVKLSRTRA